MDSKNYYIIFLAPSQQSRWVKETEIFRYGNQNIAGLENWIDIVIKSVERIHGQGAKYIPVWAGRRASIGLFIMSKEGIKTNQVYSGSLGTGLMGWYGNKGTLGVALECELERFPDSSISISFINCHLAAHSGEANCIWRQQESDHILACLQLYPVPTNEPVKKSKIVPENSQVVFLLGDLNYRLKGNKPDWSLARHGPENLPKRSEILEFIEEKNVNKLLELDEILYLREKQLGLLSFFKEARITWLPSYKFAKD